MMTAGIRDLKLVLAAGIVLASLTACLARTPTSPTSTLSSPTPTLTATQPPTPTDTPTSPPTATATPTPAPSPCPETSPSSVEALDEGPTPAPTPDVALTRGPYLQSVTTSTIIVAWETDLPSRGEIAYGETAAYGSSATDAAVGTRHAVTLTGLVPHTTYRYRVESDSAPLTEEAAFRTAAGPDQTAFTFVVFGDTRTQHQFHQAVVNRIVEQKPDFALHTGDLVAHGSVASEWETFFEIERELMARVPLFPALGNHEGNAPIYFDLFYLPGNERWYTFVYGNARFVCLEIDGIANFAPGSEQYVWLDETLAANTRPWLFVFFHYPPYTSAEEVQYESDLRQTLVPLFERYGVDVVFNGHKHDYERNEMNGVTYVVTGGGGAPLYPMQEQEPTQAAFAVEHHFVLVEIDSDHLRAAAISVDGEVLDVFERDAE